MKYHNQITVALFLCLALASCKKENKDDEETIPTPTAIVIKDSYFYMNPDTMYNPLVTKYQLPTGSYVVKAYSQSNEIEMYIYFKGSEPALNSKYVLIDNRTQPNLNNGEAFIRYKNAGTTYYNTTNDTIRIAAYGNQKIVQGKRVQFAKDNNTDIRTGSVSIVF